MNHLILERSLMSVDVFGRNYLNSNIRKKRNIQAKQGKLLTKQGRKSKY